MNCGKVEVIQTKNAGEIYFPANGRAIRENDAQGNRQLSLAPNPSHALAGCPPTRPLATLIRLAETERLRGGGDSLLGDGEAGPEERAAFAGADSGGSVRGSLQRRVRDDSAKAAKALEADRYEP